MNNLYLIMCNKLEEREYLNICTTAMEHQLYK